MRKLHTAWCTGRQMWARGRILVSGIFTTGLLGCVLVWGHGVFFATGFWHEWSNWAWVHTTVKANPLLLLLSSEDTKIGLGKGRIKTVCLSYVFAVRLGTNITWNQSSVIVAFTKSSINQLLLFLIRCDWC